MSPELQLWSDAVVIADLAKAAHVLVGLKEQPGLVTVLGVLAAKAQAMEDALDGGIKVLPREGGQ